MGLALIGRHILVIVVRDAGPVLMHMRDRGIDHPRLQRAFRLMVVHS